MLHIFRISLFPEKTENCMSQFHSMFERLMQHPQKFIFLIQNWWGLKSHSLPPWTLLASLKYWWTNMTTNMPCSLLFRLRSPHSVRIFTWICLWDVMTCFGRSFISLDGWVGGSVGGGGYIKLIADITLDALTSLCCHSSFCFCAWLTLVTQSCVTLEEGDICKHTFFSCLWW